MIINYYIGQFLKSIGYKVVPDFKYPHSTLNVVEVGFALLRGMNDRPLQIVQIGAFDGKVSDPLQNVLKNNHNARVLMVEPQPQPFADLVKLYKKNDSFLLENVAITEKDGPVMLHFPVTEGPSPKASLDKVHFKRFNIKEKQVKSIQVEGLTVKTLLERKQFNFVDLLQIDTEGHDYKILKQFFNLGIHPKVINIERFHLSKSERSLLKNELSRLNYQYIDTEYDTFAVHVNVINPNNLPA